MQAIRPDQSMSNPAAVVFKSMAVIQAQLNELQHKMATLTSDSSTNCLAVKGLIVLERNRQTTDDTTFAMASALRRINSFKGLVPAAPLDGDTIAISVWMLHLMIENPFITTEHVSKSLQEMNKPTDEQLHTAASLLPVMYPNLEAARKDLFVLEKNQLQHIMGLECDDHKGTLSTIMEFAHQCEERDANSPRARISNDGDITAMRIGRAHRNNQHMHHNLITQHHPATQHHHATAPSNSTQQHTQPSITHIVWVGEPLPNAALRAWAAFLQLEDTSHFEVRGNAFYTLTEEQLTALKAAASEFPLVPVRPHPTQVMTPNFAPNLMHLPYGYHQAFEPPGMPGMHPFHFGFPVQQGFAPPGVSQTFPSNFQRPSTVQVSEIDEQPHITSLMKLNPKLFNALVAAYPNKHIPLLSVAQLKTLVNKYGKECDKPAPPSTRSRKAADASDSKKKSAKRPAERLAEESADEEEEEPDAEEDLPKDSSKEPSKDSSKGGKTKVDKPKKAGKADKAKRKKAKVSDAVEESQWTSREDVQ